METLSQRFLNDAGVLLYSYIKYGCKVTLVKLQPNGQYRITSKNSVNGSHEYVFVVVAAPIPAIKSAIFDPPFSDDLRSAINDMHYVHAVKIFLQTKSPFWLCHGVDGMIISDMTSECFYCVFTNTLFIHCLIIVVRNSSKYLLRSSRTIRWQRFDKGIIHMGKAGQQTLHSFYRRKDNPCD